MGIVIRKKQEIVGPGVERTGRIVTPADHKAEKKVSPSWYQVGAAGEAAAAKRLEEFAKTSPSKNRFWMKEGASTKITFLDSKGFWILEHAIFRGKSPSYYTCISEMTNCPLCDAGDSPSQLAVWTIIDHTVYKRKSSNVDVKSTKRLLALKKRARLKVISRREQRLDGDLTYAVFAVARNDNKEAATGEDYDYISRLDESAVRGLQPKDYDVKLHGDWLAPYDYVTVFEPRSVEDLMRVAGMGDAPGVGSGAFRDAYSPGGDSVRAGDDIESLL